MSRLSAQRHPPREPYLLNEARKSGKREAQQAEIWSNATEKLDHTWTAEDA